jgi:hypothetical protein
MNFNESVDERVNELLSRFEGETRIAITPHFQTGFVKEYYDNQYSRDVLRKTLKDMCTLGILQKELFLNQDGVVYSLTAFGYTVQRSGGWKEYNKTASQDKQRERESIEASITTNRTFRKTIWLTIFVAVVSAVGTLGQWLLPLKQSEPPKEKLPTQTEHPLSDPCCKHQCQ